MHRELRLIMHTRTKWAMSIVTALKIRAEKHVDVQFGGFLGAPSTHGGRVDANANGSDLIYRFPEMF